MKCFLVLIGVLLCSSLRGRAETLVFAYRDFGPQVAVVDLIGNEWYQWESHGDDDPDTHADIKVVVFWDDDLDAVSAKFPVVKEEEKDYRYLEYEQAVDHLVALIAEFTKAELPTDRLEETLGMLLKARRE